MNAKELREYVENGSMDAILKQTTCRDEVLDERQRCLDLLDRAVELYGDGDWHFVSSPGRSEIGGNHTDHQHGHVLAASLNMDNLAVVKKNGSMIANFKDPLFTTYPVDLEDLAVHKEQYNTSESLIRGIAARIKELGFEIGGFDALCHSKVLAGSGISSSACFEVMVVEIFNCLFNQERIDDVERAKISQYSENVFFGKPSGLLDQMSISVGGFTAIDFKDTAHPVIDHYDFSFSKEGYELILVNTKGDHADLSHEYAAIPNEIKLVAHELNAEVLADTSSSDFFENLGEIRTKLSNDRALLRSIHIYKEDKVAVLEKQAVEAGDMEGLLSLMRKSGQSSYMYLQNVCVSSRPASQNIPLALAISDWVLGDRGVCRVHGGGFEGTIQAVVPFDLVDEYCKVLGSVYGSDALLPVRIRSFGTKTLV